MAPTAARRSSPALPALVLAASAWLLASLVWGPADSESFLTAPAASSRFRGRTAMRGFKDDFEAWRATLTPEEKKFTLKQAQNEYSKKFRKSDDFKLDVSEDKIKSFSKILSKFFEAEADDYKKNAKVKDIDYDALNRKVAGKTMDMGLRYQCVQVDRQADRRYHFASRRIQDAKEKGEKYPQASPMVQTFGIENTEGEAHNKNLELIEFLKELRKDPDMSQAEKDAIDKIVADGVPPAGEGWGIQMSDVLFRQTNFINEKFLDLQAAFKENRTDLDYDKEVLPNMKEAWVGTMKYAYENWVKARDEVEEDANIMKKFFRSQKDVPGKTKADVLKEIWSVLPKVSGKTLPPLDEEMLAELAQEPATVKGEFNHTWGTADTLWKSEAIDAFGTKFLLGVYETQEEARQAFDNWNGEYEAARVAQKDEMAQWVKTQQAAMDKETDAQERIRKILEEARR